MSSAFYVEDAADKVRWLVQRETRGPGDLDNAMRRLARRHGVPFHTLWALRYRRPSDLLVSSYSAITDAYHAEVERQARLIAHEKSRTQPQTLVGRAMVRAAAALAGAGEPDLGGEP